MSPTYAELRKKGPLLRFQDYVFCPLATLFENLRLKSHFAGDSNSSLYCRYDAVKRFLDAYDEL